MWSYAVQKLDLSVLLEVEQSHASSKQEAERLCWIRSRLRSLKTLKNQLSGLMHCRLKLVPTHHLMQPLKTQKWEACQIGKKSNAIPLYLS